jgi:hypothetical protein
MGRFDVIVDILAISFVFIPFLPMQMEVIEVSSLTPPELEHPPPLPKPAPGKENEPLTKKRKLPAFTTGAASTGTASAATWDPTAHYPVLRYTGPITFVQTAEQATAAALQIIEYLPSAPSSLRFAVRLQLTSSCDQ